MSGYPLSQPDASPDSPAAIRKHVFNLAWPVMAEMFLQTFTQIVSMALVGHLGATAVASIGLSMQPLHLVYGVFMGISVGATAVVSRLVGMGDERQAARASSQAMSSSSIIALLATVLLLFGSRRVVALMGAEPAVIEEGSRYLRVMAPGLCLMWISTVLTGAMRGAGDTRTPMRVNIIINILNFVGNLCLVHGLWGFPALGVLGAGIATTGARLVGGVLLIGPYLLGRSVLNVRFPEDFTLDKPLLRRILRIALPGALERLTLASGQLFYTRMISNIGTVAYAAHVIGVNAESLSYMPGTGFGTAATTLVGQNLGRDRPDLAEKSAYESLRLAYMFMGAMGVLLFCFPGALMRVYTSDPEIIRLGCVYLRIMALAQIPTAIGNVFPGALRGAGDTKFVLYMTTGSVWAVRLVVTYVTLNVLKIGVAGAWYAMAFDWCFRALLSYLWFRTGKWKQATV